MQVLDTSAYLNGRRDHYPADTFPSVWALVGEAILDGRIILPREVYRELLKKDDEISQWIREFDGAVTEPDEAVQRRAGEIYATFPNPGQRDGADPFVIAEAEIREFTVVTYEGRSFSGVPTARWDRTMPGICKRVGIRCRTLPEALTALGASF